MSLSEQDREALADAMVHANEASCWSCDEAPFAPVVEAIVARHVRAALTEAAEQVEADGHPNPQTDLHRYARRFARIVRSLIPDT